jgi:hypothetical protein
MEKVSEELREKRGKDSLLDIHGKKLKKKKNKEDDGQPKVRPLSYNLSNQKSWQAVVVRTARAMRMMGG